MNNKQILDVLNDSLYFYEKYYETLYRQDIVGEKKLKELDYYLNKIKIYQSWCSHPIHMAGNIYSCLICGKLLEEKDEKKSIKLLEINEENKQYIIQELRALLLLLPPLTPERIVEYINGQLNNNLSR